MDGSTLAQELQAGRSDFSSCRMDDKLMQTVCEHFTNHTKINLRGNSIGNDGLRVLAAALKTHTSLKILNLSDNPSIGPDGAASLADALSMNQVLEELYLSHNSAGDEGVKAIAKALEDNKCLKKLYLNHVELSLDGLEELCRRLANNAALQVLWLYDNKFKESAVPLLSNLLESNCALLRVWIQSPNSSKLDFFCNLNRRGRYQTLLRQDCPEGLVPFGLARIGNKFNKCALDHVYFTLRNKPELGILHSKNRKRKLDG